MYDLVLCWIQENKNSWNTVRAIVVLVIVHIFYILVRLRFPTEMIYDKHFCTINISYTLNVNLFSSVQYKIYYFISFHVAYFFFKQNRLHKCNKPSNFHCIILTKMLFNYLKPMEPLPKRFLISRYYGNETNKN